MNSADKIEHLIKNFCRAQKAPIKTTPQMDNKILKDALTAYKNSNTPPSAERPKIRRKIMKRPIIKLTAAAVIIIAVLIGIKQFGGSVDLTSIAFAEIKNAVNKMPLMHTLLDTNSDGHQSNTEKWYCFESKSVLAKHVANGKRYKISSLNYDTMENVVYESNSDVVKVSYRVDVSPKNLHTSPWVVLENYIKNYERQGALITREKEQFEGENVDVYFLTIPSDFRKERTEAEFFVNRSSRLPILYKRKIWTSDGQLRVDQVIRFDFPESGPVDIYDLGVSRTTKVVRDLESKKRLEDKAVYEKQFKEIYRLEEGEILKHIPLSLATPRIKIDEINNTNEENHHAMFSWDGERAKPQAIFTEGVSLETAFEKIVVLSQYQYDSIPDTLGSIKIPGDWVVRNGTPKEQLLRAFEKILRDFTNRTIHFEKRQVERNVIAVRGAFYFKPLSGTYDDSWIHVFSDKLDTDERGGGGTYSLDSFLTQRLAKQLKLHVVNLTELSGNVRIKCGCHMSAYLDKIAPGPERDAKLDQLLANLAEQMSLTFTKELRKVNIWSIVQGD